MDIRAGNAMTTPGKDERDRRASEYRGFVAIILALIVLIGAAVRHDENSWQGLLLGGVSLAFGVFSLARALRR